LVLSLLSVLARTTLVSWSQAVVSVVREPRRI
jgi:hypothetical protein